MALHAPFTADEVLEALREVAAGVDGPLSSYRYQQLRRRGEHPTLGTVSRLFDSWPAALEAAGLPSTGRRWRRWTEQEAAEAIAAWLEHAPDDRYATYAAAAVADRSLPNLYVVGRWFGGWKRARAAAYAVTSSDSRRG